MSALKTFGLDVLKVAGIVLGIVPIAKQLVPAEAGVIDKVASGLTKFFAIVQDVEVAGAAISAPGPDKLKMATPLIAQEVFNILDQLGYEVANQAAYTAAVTGYASVTADLLNSIKKK